MVNLVTLFTAWKVSKYGVFSGLHFPVFRLNTEIYRLNLRIQSEHRKIRARKNSVFGHFSPSDYSGYLNAPSKFINFITITDNLFLIWTYPILILRVTPFLLHSKHTERWYIPWEYLFLTDFTDIVWNWILRKWNNLSVDNCKWCQQPIHETGD